MTNREKIDCIQTKTILEVIHTNCPKDVKANIQELWIDVEFGNDDYYYSWEEDGETYNGVPLKEAYPALYAYLKSHNITKCLIHYWW